MAEKLPSPCLSVCKFKRAGHCIACSMTKEQKAIFKKLKKNKEKAAFLILLLAQQDQLGQYPGFRRTYARKCKKRGVENPIAA
ncbi:MAG: DUF1289 domain-containing protein [Pseudomonadota bacterium]